MSERLVREREFHNRVFADDTRSVMDRVYEVDRASREWYEDSIRALVKPGTRVLDYGCSSGRYSRVAAKCGADVVGVDLSEVAIDQARRAAANHGLSTIDFRVMNAEALEFPDHSFDLVFGAAILHHLDLGRAYREIRRVTKPSGTALFLEPMGHNPAINLYRRLTPSLRTEDEHPLRMSDLRSAKRVFDQVEWQFFALHSLAAIPFVGTRCFGPVLAAGEFVDRVAFRVFPPLSSLAWQVGLRLKPSRQ